MPVEGRRVGHHAERIVVDLERAVHRLDHDRGAARVVQRVVERRRDAQVRLRDVDDGDAGERRLHLGH